MSPQNWQQLKELFHAALEREPAARERFLREACAGDSGLLGRVLSLVSADEEAGDFIAGPALIPLGELLAEAEKPPAVSGQRVGSYEIVRELGRGGMGAVYLAVRADEQFDKRVAVKVVKRGMDTDFVLRRFARERQVLASLDHPNIARLLDGGATEDGLPYFVMEYVEGAPVNQYSDEHRLSITGRLELFRRICAAVSYAHQNLIVHRDLKPSNILVTRDGTPKLLDFGIAKLLNPELSAETVDQTATAMRLMTPEYASPEQVRGAPITTASDVYSLGVLLYELLTGRRPYRLKNRTAEEVVSAVCEQAPERPSTAVSRAADTPADGADNVRPRAPVTPAAIADTRDTEPARLRRALAGDLDTIILKALRKEPQRRYASVEQFSEDVRRHLEGLPVAAQRDTFAYRTNKFIGRHRAGVAAVALVLVLLVAGVVATAWQAHRANMERARAERRFNDVRKLANSFLFEFYEAIVNLPGSTAARELLVKRALEYLDSLSKEASGDASLQYELGLAYEKVGNVQGYGVANLGDTSGALSSYRKSLALYEAAARAETSNTEYRRSVAIAHSYIGDMLERQNDDRGALESYQEQRIIVESLLAAETHNAKFQRAVGIAYNSIANISHKIGDDDLALEYLNKALALREPLCAADETNVSLCVGLANTYSSIGLTLESKGDLTGALANHYQSQEVLKKIAAADPVNTLVTGSLAQARLYVGEILIKKNDPRGALKQFREALHTFQSLASADPKNVDMQRWIAISYKDIGQAQAKEGAAAAALESFRQSANVNEAILKIDDSDADTRTKLADGYFQIGATYASLAAATKTPMNGRVNHWREARTWFQKSLDIYQEMQVRGVLSRAELSKPDEVAHEIKKCAERLAKL